MQIAAYYYPATKAQKAKGKLGALELHTIDNGHRVHVQTVSCYGAKDARDYAKAHGATPWNF